MLDSAIELQNNAVSELVEETKNPIKSTITFKAPTGCGKTYMMADYMNRMLSKENDIVFIVSTLSKGKLAEQNYNQFKKYKEDGLFSYLNPTIISTEKTSEERMHIPEDYNVYVLPRDLYKVSTDLVKDGAFERFLQHLQPSLLHVGTQKKIYLIKDESHQATNNLDALRKKGYFFKTINFSATPVEKEVDVEIKEEDAVACKIIKGVSFCSDEDTNEKLEEAVKFFANSRKEYTDLIKVHPCMMIQIANNLEGKEQKEEIVRIVEKYGLKWVALYSESVEGKNGKTKMVDRYDTNDQMKLKKLPTKKWVDYVKGNTSDFDIIIFKLAVAEGWDIPRACMLYQRRNTQSEQLDKQVMGRVRRNPLLLTFENVEDKRTIELATTAWVWGMEPKDETIQVRLKNKEKTQEEIRVKTTRLRKLKDAEFKLENVLCNKKVQVDNKDIFTLYRDYEKSNQEIRLKGREYSKDYQSWIEFASNIGDITKEYNKKICNYEDSMEITKNENNIEVEATMPVRSAYTSTSEEVEISSCVWERVDGDTSFSFDSKAETKWIHILEELCNTSIPNSQDRIVKYLNGGLVMNQFLWGKNYLPNSEIKFEYYLNGTHYSYPDFIMKDSFDRIHIFEVKSTNPSNQAVFDTEEYKIKIEELKKCYLQASKITENIFYIPILKNNEWSIYRYKKGEEKILSLSMFKQSLLENDK